MGTGRDGLCGMLGGTAPHPQNSRIPSSGMGTAGAASPAPGGAAVPKPPAALVAPPCPSRWPRTIPPRSKAIFVHQFPARAVPGCIPGRQRAGIILPGTGGGCSVQHRPALISLPNGNFTLGKKSPAHGRCLLAPQPGSKNILVFCQHTEQDFSWRLPRPFPAGASLMDHRERHKGHQAVGMALPGHRGTAHQVPARMEFTILVFPSGHPIVIPPRHSLAAHSGIFGVRLLLFLFS